MFSTDKAWKKWGSVDPYYGVLTSPEFRGESLEANRQMFFETGVAHIDATVEKFELYFGPLPKGRALDFGCGVGRLAIPLRKYFNEVVGLDISADMVAEGARNVSQANLTNVHLHLSDDEMSNAKGSFAFVSSYIVLQHIPIPRGLEITRKLLNKLEVGGGASLHYSIERRQSVIRRLLYAAKRDVPAINGFVNLVKGRKFSEPLMQMNEYSLAALLTLFAESGIEPLMIDTEMHGNILTATLYGKKS